MTAAFNLPHRRGASRILVGHRLRRDIHGWRNVTLEAMTYSTLKLGMHPHRRHPFPSHCLRRPQPILLQGDFHPCTHSNGWRNV